jgi:5-(carboxyamino)imidazole ribonucleotide synthase
MSQPAAPLSPGATIGILGGGQLGRMLALAGARLGLKTHIFCPEPDAPAFHVCAARTVAAYDDEAALARFAEAVDVVTYEFENIPAAALEILSPRVAVRPGVAALAVAQDRLNEKTFLTKHGIAVAPWAEVNSDNDLRAAVDKIGLPAVLKTRRYGYDGKGQVMLHGEGDVAGARAAIGNAPAVLEGFVRFAHEVSVIAARGFDGRMACYDMGENVHARHILDETRVPARVAPETAERGIVTARTILEALDYVGVAGIEMFLMPDGALIVNEIAPRVHNSGHWTLEACAASQFENHMRAVAGWPLASTARHADAIMKNLIGAEANRWATLAAAEGNALHLYGKGEARPGRKMGHVTRLYPPGERPDAFDG